MLLDDIILWANTLPHWQKMISYYILHSIKIDEIGMDKIYEAFKRERGLSEGSNKDFDLDQIQSDAQDGSSIYWRGIENVQGVNALSSQQKLEIGPQLTIIYGKNGSGKSSYSRIFNNAFMSRGDKTLLPNIYSKTKSVDRSAELIFEVDKEEKRVFFPKNLNSQRYSRKVSVFDAISAMGDMTKENELSLSPIEFNFFDSLVRCITNVKEKLEVEKRQNREPNSFSDYFDTDTDIKKVVSEINGKTNIKELRLKFDISTEDLEKSRKYVARKKELEALNISEKLKQIDDLAIDIESVKSIINQQNDKVSKERLEKIQKLIEKQNKLFILSSQEGLKQFDGDDIKNIGSSEWKNFIEAAKTYHDSIVESDGTELDYCVLCKQDISKIELIDKYWSYLKSEAEVQLTHVNKEIGALSKDFEKLKNLDMIHPQSKLYEYLKSHHDETLEQISEFKKRFCDCIDDVMLALSEKRWNMKIDCQAFDVSNLDDVSQILTSEKKKLNSEKVNEELKKIKVFFGEYNAKLCANKLLPKIEGFIIKSAWVENADKQRISTSSVTRKQKELFNKYVTEEYVERFQIECKNLNVDFGVNPTQRGAVGTTRNKLSIKGKNLNEVFSEGEQRSVALANFLAETGISSENSCVIFDDPVSSLDYERRDCIANRLVSLAREKQVVILTHDLSFMKILENLAEKYKIDCKFQHIQTLPTGDIGIISNNIPWIGMKVPARIRSLRGQLQTITAQYRKCKTSESFAEYYSKVKLWCENLRETWERVVEETLLCSAIERYKPSVNTQSLKKATFTKELYPEIESGMSECSSWVHDRAEGLGESIPKPEELEKYLERCDNFIKMYQS